MSSAGGGRKKHKGSKASSHHKHSQAQTDNSQRLRDISGQQQKQEPSNYVSHKPTGDTKSDPSQHNHATTKQQPQQQQQQKQQPQQQFKESLASATENLETKKLNPNVAGTQGNNKKKINNSKSAQENVGMSLHTVIAWGRKDLLQALLQTGSNPSEMDKEGNNALMMACRIGDMDIIMTLWDAVDSGKQDSQQANKDGDTALHVCALAGNEDGCRFLISKQFSPSLKNKSGETALHLAAKHDYVTVCNLLLDAVLASDHGVHELQRLVLEENEKGQTAICLSILHQHTQVSRILLAALIPEQQAIYLENRFSKVLNKSPRVCYSKLEPSSQQARDLFLHGLLISTSVLLMRLSDRSKQLGPVAADNSPCSRLDHCLTNTDIIEMISRVSCGKYANKQTTPIACFLLVYLLEGVSEQINSFDCDNQTETLLMEQKENIPLLSNKKEKPGSRFLQQFLSCNGPNNLLLKVSDLDVSESSEAMAVMALALPIVVLVRSKEGRSWLEANRTHLTFLKEVVLQKRPMLDLLTNTCPLLSRSRLEVLCQDFVRFVEALEARDREQNLAELLLEEERDRKRRERKKRKHKKQLLGTEVKADLQAAMVQSLDASSDEERTESLDVEDINFRLNMNTQRNKAALFTIDNCVMKGQELLDSNSEMAEALNQPKDSENHCFWKRPDSSGHEICAQAEKLVNVATKNAKREMKYFEEIDRIPCTDLNSNPENNEAEARTSYLRWADVAKIGCSVSDREMSYSNGSEKRSRSFPNRTISCEWPISTTANDEDFCEKSSHKDLLGAAACSTESTIGACWYSQATPGLVDVLHSDEESSSTSSSSSDSPSSSPVSDSFHLTQHSLWRGDQSTQDVSLEDSSSLRTRTPKSRKRRKSKQTLLKSRENNMESYCSPTFESLFSSPGLYIPPGGQSLGVSRLPALRECLRPHSDNSFKTGQEHSQRSDTKLSDSIPLPRKASYPSKGLVTTGFTEVPTSNLRQVNGTEADLMAASIRGILYHKEEKPKLSKTWRNDNINLMSISNTTAASSLSPSHSVLISKSNVTPHSHCVPCTPPPPPPPPGFHSLPVADIISGQNNTPGIFTDSFSTSSTRSLGSGGDGKMVTAISVDEVTNPRTASCKGTVPPLSVLAWKSCGQESKTFSGKEDMKFVAYGTTPADKSGQFDTRFNTAIGTTDCNEPVIANRQLNTEIHGAKVPVKSPMEYNPISTSTFTTFSAILMNRMQQRSQRRQGVKAKVQCKDSSLYFSNQKLYNLKFAQKVNPCDHDMANLTPSSAVSSNAGARNDHQHSDRNCGNCAGQLVQDRAAGNNNQQDRRGTDASGIHEVKNTSQDDSDKPVGLPSSENRGISPPVLFPERIREENKTTASSFPSFHDMQTSDFLSDMFSDPLFTDNIAINQIRQKIWSGHSNLHNQHDISGQSVDSCDVDLDYYASVYQIKFRHVLASKPGPSAGVLSSRSNSFGNKPPGFKDSRDWVHSQNILGLPTKTSNQMENGTTRKHSVRWNRPIQKLLDLLWTTRQQYGSIVLPNMLPEFSIGMIGNSLILLGFLVDGSEVAVFVVDKSVTQIAPRMLEIMTSPDVERYFLMHCKSFSESSGVQYLAADLYEFTLCEYLQLYLPACSHNQEVHVLLVWQLFQAVAFLHIKLCVPHGYLTPSGIFINKDGNLRVASFGIPPPLGERGKHFEGQEAAEIANHEYRHPWIHNDEMMEERSTPSFCNDIYAAGKLACFILTKGQHFFGMAHLETEMNFLRDHLNCEAFDLISPMLCPEPQPRPHIDQCLKHPIFWSADKKFRLILIVGSDVLTEMKTGVALTGTGAPTMMEILSLIDINLVSPNWIHKVDSTVLKEMRSFRVYKNNLAELTLFVYNCCLHFDKLSNLAKEVLDDPCKYFQNLFPSLFMAIFRSLKSSDRIDRTCYKPFF